MLRVLIPLILALAVLGHGAPAAAIASNTAMDSVWVWSGSAWVYKNIAGWGPAPTISSGFGTNPSITVSLGPGSFRLNVGTGGTASTGVIGLPTAPNGWNCFCSNTSSLTATVFSCRQTANTANTVTMGNFSSVPLAAAWAASDILAISCFAF